MQASQIFKAVSAALRAPLRVAGQVFSPPNHQPPPVATKYNTSGVMIPRTCFSKYYRNRSKYSPRECRARGCR